MSQTAPSAYDVRLANTAEELAAAQRLRYAVFVKELGGDGALVDHRAGLEKDAFDPFCDHLILCEKPSGAVVGVYRLLRAKGAAQAGGFYCAQEYDLSPLIRSGRNLLELGRSCLHPDHRGGTAMHELWSALGRYVAAHQIEILFGVASFHGTDIAQLSPQLSVLHHRHLAPLDLRVKALEKSFQSMDLIDKVHLDARAAMVQVPSLIKAYLRLGGYVGEGAFVDHAFNTTDVCLVMDTNRMTARQARLYAGVAK